MIECTQLTKETLPYYANMIPKELYPKITSGSSMVLGAHLGQMPIGALVCTQKIQDSTLQSIYIMPFARRLGIARSLLEAYVAQMRRLAVRKASFRYLEDGDRLTLAPFFENVGILCNTIDRELALITLAEASECLPLSQSSSTHRSGTSIQACTRDERMLLYRFVQDQINADLSEASWTSAEGYMILKDQVLQGLSLFREDDGQLILEYLYVQENHPLLLASLLARSTQILQEKYPESTNIRMILANSASQKLFHRLQSGQTQPIRLRYGTITF